jgi:hypothetical protein
MARTRGGPTGQTRSLRLPTVLDDWFEARMRAHPHRSASDLLVELIHGGLRLRDAYMSIHRYALEARVAVPAAYAEYRACLTDTFGAEYVDHVERWLEADGVTVPATAVAG